MRDVLRDLARPLGNPKVVVDKYSGNVTGCIRCTMCSWPGSGRAAAWSTNIVWVMDRWAEHLAQRHPDNKIDWKVTTEALPESLQPSQEVVDHAAAQARRNETYGATVRELVAKGKLGPEWLDKLD